MTFGALHNFPKVTDVALELWAQVLAEVPGSRLKMLFAGEADDCERLLSVFARYGVAPQRVDLLARLPRRKYLELHQQIDMGLDTFPYNGHTTTCDALWMGVPVVSLAGVPHVARVGLSFVSAAGLGDLVVTDSGAFVQTAVKLAQDRERLQSLRTTLREQVRACPLMDGADFTRRLEAAYRAMWRRYCAAQA